MSGVCAIHQPNLFPRGRTLDKLLAADVWVVLDDVQLCRRDYQHRARIGRARSPQTWQWLTIPVHLPSGQTTRIRDVRIADPVTARRRISGLTRQFYRRAPQWDHIAGIVDETAASFARTDRLSDIAELSATAMLRRRGWTGDIIRSSDLTKSAPIRAGRSERLVDLVLAAGCTSYLCGRGGISYLDPDPFVRARVEVSVTRASRTTDSAIGLDDLSALAAMVGGTPAA